MPRHSKNNTASSVFTYAEREKLKYGTQKQRLGRDSFRDFDACYLCLNKAREPLSCVQGHITCKECIFENILAQKKEIERQKKIAEVISEQIKDSTRTKMVAEREEEIKKFEKTQTSLLSNSESSSKSSKPALPSFWIPSLTPESNAEVTEPPEILKKEVVCTATSTEHPISLKKLFPVHFQSVNNDSGPNQDQSPHYVCPSCSKQLTNGLKMWVLRPCGHVFCHHCTSKFVKTSKRCTTCDAKLKEKDVVSIYIEGTGFAGKGKVEAEKFDHAFQG
ncbi:hypothetical protein BKA69DRAFT_1030675 [Paraphysoderma sedebokerense]|nr:hypothetical protein BKA69DRAFT_1030675 [Paraphysoderma sedebokerense]